MHSAGRPVQPSPVLEERVTEGLCSELAHSTIPTYNRHAHGTLVRYQGPSTPCVDQTGARCRTFSRHLDLARLVHVRGRRRPCSSTGLVGSWTRMRYTG